MRHLARNLERIAHEALPEMRGTPIYVECVRGTTVWGLTSGLCDLVLRPQLEQCGRWRGRGIGIQIDAENIARSHRGKTRYGRLEESRRAILETVVHELGHAIERMPDADVRGDDSIGAQRQRTQAVLRGLAPIESGPNSDVPWTHHEISFIRNCLHLIQRFRWSGHFVTKEGVFASPLYGLSPMHIYAARLGDECHRFAHVPIFEIQNHPMPDAFRALWKADIRHWTQLKLAEFKRENEENAMSVIEQLVGRLRNRKQKRLESVHEIAERIGRGEDVKIETVEAVLVDANWEPEQLEELIGKYRVRHQKRLRLAECERLDKEGGKLDGQLAALDAKFEQVEQQWRDDRAPLAERLETICKARCEADSIRMELKIGSPNLALEEGRKEISARHAELTKRRYDLTVRLQELKGYLKQKKRQHELSGDPSLYGDEVKNLENRIAQTTDELAEVDREIPIVEREEEKAMQKVAAC